jgi:bifunctional ADP-heptose synthase (sugar kinase/adenylyltransferase)
MSGDIRYFTDIVFGHIFSLLAVIVLLSTDTDKNNINCDNTKKIIIKIRILLREQQLMRNQLLHRLPR